MQYDAIIVGGRVAGASTALLLARAGWRVLVLDRQRRGSDTPSTHALMRPAVLQLERWGLLEDLVTTGAPGQQRVVFHYGDRPVVVEASRRLYAPRRTVLDPLLVRAAERSGAELRHRVTVRDLLRDAAGRVIGVRARDEHGRTEDLHATITVGADGRASAVAAMVDAPFTMRGASASGFLYSYWTGVEAAGFEWSFGEGASGGLIPTNDGQVCVFAGVPSPDLAALRDDPEASLLQVLARTQPALAARVDVGTRVEPVRAVAGVPGWLRRPWGPGWALAGDAGHYLDPTTAHGISSALRDAELLARAIDALLREDDRSALVGYERLRDELSEPLLRATDAIAGFGWRLDDLQDHHLAMSAAMKREVQVLESLDWPGSRDAAA